MEVKIQIPDNCELIKDGDTYIVKEKKQEPPRSWEEFCKNYPKTANEHYIWTNSSIVQVDENSPRNTKHDKNHCISREEAEAFLALMQLRQLRKAWVGDWEPDGNKYYYAIISQIYSCSIAYYNSIFRSMSFPTKEMAEDFLSCFSDLCEKAKTLL